ncbi:cupin domain-containing protein [Prolixibacter sp. SD074]|uniref:cupin domain-containing protein n=1 Tax=Prolixibacter sp. SD074 TaxID=2652391 RepID=UPI00126A8857|nr:cupin domain-containing protein [Prolixibacter sp. SD074]GET29381.1 cupin [Prolixibacter sp. SD074]
MIARTIHSTPKKENPHGVEVHKMYDDPTAQIMHMTLQPGEGLKPHTTPVDVTFYVLEGRPTVLIGEETKHFEEDTLIESPAHIVHSLLNESEQVARVLVIKAPRPSGPGKMVPSK